MAMEITEMIIKDYEEVFGLWENTENVGLHDDTDSKEGIDKYLKRNPSLSFVARDNAELIGAVLCGHDSRRGYLHHLAVANNHRKKGLGKTLTQHALAALAKAGINKCHVFVFADNLDGQKFWKTINWTFRTDIYIISKNIG